jgi:hypothetical protein
MLLRAGALENRTFRYSAMVGAGAVACLVAVWSANDGASTASAADALASRFPREAPAAAAPAQPQLDQRRAEADRALFIPSLTYPPTLAMSRAAPSPASPAPAAAPKLAAPPQAAAPVQTAQGDAAPTHRLGPQLASASSRPAPAPPARTQAHSPNVLNDAQIASMKQRLKLTPEQERMWPSVEAALRKLAYAKSPDRTRRDPFAGIDPSSSEVSDLKWAAFPLVMSFSEDQRRELIDLAHVAGLEKLVPQF